jgi:hypothetical protein
MSTKLTARKRYIPRIDAGVLKFNSLRENPTEENIAIFLKDTLPGLSRAMNLYGDSLRKGEYPDEISAKAESLTDKFVVNVLTLKDLKESEKVSQQIDRSRSAFDEYLNFAKFATTLDKSRN